MDTSKRKIARNAAKVEFLANAEEVTAMLDKGFNKLNVYKALAEQGRLTMSYRSFCWHLQQLKNPKKEKKQPVKQITSTPLRVAPKKEGFGQLEDIDVKSLV